MTMFGLRKLKNKVLQLSDDFKSSVSELELQILWGDLPPEKREQGKRILERVKASLEKRSNETTIVKKNEINRPNGGAATI
jgi:hypothetical protein